MVISRNLVVFALAGLAMLAAAYIPLPGIDLAQFVSPNAVDPGGALSRISVFAVSLQSILVAFMLVEFGKLFTRPKGERLEGAPVPTAMIVRLLALGISALDGYAIAGHFEASGYVRPDFPWFMPVAIASYVASTAFALFLVDRVKLAGFPNGLWALIALQVVSGIDTSVWLVGDLVRTGAISYKIVLIAFVYFSLCIAVVVFVAGLWNGLGSKDEQPLSRDILIWPMVLSASAASILMSGLGFGLATFVPVDLRPLHGIMFDLFFVLLIPLFVFAYAKRSRLSGVSSTRVAMAATLIALVQIALFVLNEVYFAVLSGLPYLPGGQSLLALVLTAVGIGVLKVPVIFPEADEARPADVN